MIFEEAPNKMRLDRNCVNSSSVRILSDHLKLNSRALMRLKRMEILHRLMRSVNHVHDCTHQFTRHKHNLQLLHNCLLGQQVCAKSKHRSVDDAAKMQMEINGRNFLRLNIRKKTVTTTSSVLTFNLF